MKFAAKITVFFMLALVPRAATAGETAEHGIVTGQTSAPVQEKSLYPALLGGVFSNTVFHLTSRLFGADFAQTSLESIKTNVSSLWVWDDDHFLFNHPGHPYQGSLYHTAARASGFTFYESMVFDFLGSVIWEWFGETDIPSLNDLIVTTYGGAVFGEMLHRLYLETLFPFAGVLVSPMDAITDTVFQKRPRRTRNLYYLSAMAGMSWIESSRETRSQFNNTETGLLSNELILADIGCEVVYGNPFLHHSRIPYSQFEIMMQFGGSISRLWLDWTILTDGYLFAFNPVDTEKNAFSTGLTLHYDLITGNNTNFANQALDWSVKWRRTYKTTGIELKAHLGWTFFGSSQYYPEFDHSGTPPDIPPSQNDYGIGGNTKITFTVQTARFGKLSIGSFNYLLYMLPRNKPESRGIDYFVLSYLEYSYPFTTMFSLNINNALYIKSMHSHYHANMTEAANRIMLFARWTFLDKGRSQA